MATLPDNQKWTGDNWRSVNHDPEGKHLLVGMSQYEDKHTFLNARTLAMASTTIYTLQAVNVYGRVIGGNLVFCVATTRKIQVEQEDAADYEQTHEFFSESDYITKHAEIIERDGVTLFCPHVFNDDQTMKMEAVRAACT